MRYVFCRTTEKLYGPNTAGAWFSLLKKHGLPVTDSYCKIGSVLSPKQATEFEGQCRRLQMAGGKAIGILDGCNTPNADPTFANEQMVNSFAATVERRLAWYKAAGEIAARCGLQVCVYIDNEDLIWSKYKGSATVDEWVTRRGWYFDQLVGSCILGLRASGVRFDHGVTLYGFGRAIPQIRTRDGEAVISNWGASPNVGWGDRIIFGGEAVSAEVFFWHHPDIAAATLAQTLLNVAHLRSEYDFNFEMSISHWVNRVRNFLGADVDCIDPTAQCAIGRMYAMTPCVSDVWCHLTPAHADAGAELITDEDFNLCWKQELPAFLYGVQSAI